jgi:predicted metalloprotease with PDZ domain
MDSGKNLDEFMRLVWVRHGKEEIPYTLEDLKSILGEYSTPEFADSFFSNYIYDSKLPDFNTLLATFGIEISIANPERPRLGARITPKDGKWLIASNPTRGTGLYEAGFSKGDLITSIDDKWTDGQMSVEEFMKDFKPGQVIRVSYTRFGKTNQKEVKLGSDPSFETRLMPNADDKMIIRRDAWLSPGKQ